MGAGVSKVRSLKMDKKVWTETLIKVGRSLLVTCIWGLAAAWISLPHLPISLTSAQGARDRPEGVDFGKADLGPSQQTGQ